MHRASPNEHCGKSNNHFPPRPVQITQSLLLLCAWGFTRWISHVVIRVVTVNSISSHRISNNKLFLLNQRGKQKEDEKRQIVNSDYLVIQSSQPLVHLFCLSCLFTLLSSEWDTFAPSRLDFLWWIDFNFNPICNATNEMTGDAIQLESQTSPFLVVSCIVVACAPDHKQTNKPAAFSRLFSLPFSAPIQKNCEKIWMCRLCFICEQHPAALHWTADATNDLVWLLKKQFHSSCVLRRPLISLRLVMSLDGLVQSTCAKRQKK